LPASPPTRPSTPTSDTSEVSEASDVSEDEYVTGDDVIASVQELLTSDDKITKADLEKLFSDLRSNLFGE
jgi:hypothetical protein